MTAPDGVELPSTCHCGRRVRVLWSGPIGPDSRPVLLVCGRHWHPDHRCDLRVPIPEDSIDPDHASHKEVAAASAYWVENIRPLLVGLPEEVMTAMHDKYIVEVRKNPVAVHQLMEGL